MKTNHPLRTRRLTIFLILILAMILLGITYAAWTTKLQVKTEITTGKMNIIFQDNVQGTYSISLVDSENNQMASIPANLTLLNDGKTAEIKFLNGLPLTALCQDQRIKIDFSLTGATDNTISLIQEVQPDSGQLPDAIRFVNSEILLVKAGVLYEPDSHASNFNSDLTFEAFREIKTQDREIFGSIYLKISEESKNWVESLPKTLTVDTLTPSSNVSEALQAAATDLQNGVILNYSCTIPFWVEQKAFNEKGE